MVFAKGVLHHVPPADLEEFFRNVSRLTCAETIVLIWAKFSDTATGEQTSKRTWAHSVEGVLSAARTYKLDSEMTEVDGMRVVRFRRYSLSNPRAMGANAMLSGEFYTLVLAELTEQAPTGPRPSKP